MPKQEQKKKKKKKRKKKNHFENLQRFALSSISNMLIGDRRYFEDKFSFKMKAIGQ